MTTTPKAFVNIFTDLDLNLTRTPMTHDISIISDEIAIKRSLKNLILTNRYDRPFSPDINGNVTTHLFENFSPLTEIRLEKGIRDCITSFEPRVDVLAIVVNSDVSNNRFGITIKFRVRTTLREDETKFFLERLR